MGRGMCMSRTRRNLRACATGSPDSRQGTRACCSKNKGVTLAVHYRRAPQLGSYIHQALRAEVALANRGHPGWRLQPGKGVLEVKPDGRNKGTAILEFMAEPPFRGRFPVFAGDDLTDEFGFDVVTRLGGWSVKVGEGATRAQFRLANVDAVRQWIAASLYADVT